MLTLPTTLLLLAAAPSPQLHEGLPAGFQVDGKLDEWKQPPSLALGAGNQVAGEMKVASPADLSAKVWLAMDAQGLVIAGEVMDDKVQLTNPKRDINADHVEVWLALPQPKMPPLAFISHVDEHRVTKESDCAKASPEDPAKCKTWFKQQTARRKQMQADLVAQYGLTPKGVVRFGLNGTVGQARYEPFPGGYRFEALIPTSAFPRTAQAPLKDVRVLVDLVDSDEGGVKQETFLSSSPKRKFGDASTFHAVALKKPLRFGKWPELLERALKEQPGASYAPGPDADALQVWLNPAVAYQFVPDSPSPDVVQVDLGSVTSLGKVGDVELVSVPAVADAMGTVSRWVVSRRGQTILGTQDVGRDQVKVVQRAPGMHVVQVYDGPNNPMGSGACGACPLVYFNHFTMDAQGKFSKPENLQGAGGLMGNPVEWTADEALTRIEAFEVEEDANGKRGEKRLATRHTFDAKTGKYKTETFEAPEPSGVAEDQP
ncbi:hypothetical protein HPC49_09250 [Pyxidicoccus fallax]|uniref:Uncharacterized protein n=1 Tax=Pyxidicoccus fallax TaxID=394095 RepID=A0A848LEL2_9BACT|nr:hypothetical protein [Pyxidicoccus fallax]NMO15293.1 hypothetical protein [Pyxidicoccus fallax]NPC78429.1 hypothetical protein [Pyxidicoccus fallax]